MILNSKRIIEELSKMRGTPITSEEEVLSMLKSDGIGTYVYDSSVPISYDPNVMFGKHLGVFGNTGSGKTCTVVSLIQQYIHSNPDSDIKFIILDVNGEYKAAFDGTEMDFIKFEELRFHHTCGPARDYFKVAGQGSWQDWSASCKPKAGDLVYYGAVGGTTSNHVGLVVAVDAANKTYTSIECNLSDKVKECVGDYGTGYCETNNKQIQGFARPLWT